MGNKKLAYARAMKSAITIHKRFDEALIRDKLKKTSQNSQQSKCCNAKKATTICQENITFALAMTKEILLEQNHRRIAYAIVEFILLELRAFLGSKSKKCVMEKVLSNPNLSSNMANSFLPPKVVVTIQELIVAIHTSLVETK
jgi:hypothetical protein